MRGSITATRPSNSLAFRKKPLASAVAIALVIAVASTVGVHYGWLPTVRAFNEVGSITLNSGENWVHSAVIDEANQFAYVGTATGTVVKIDLATFTEVGSLDLEPSGNYANDLSSAVIDTANQMAYFTSGGIVKVDLATFTQVDSIDTGPCLVGSSALIDPANHFAYFGGVGVVVKVDLSSFTVVSCLALSQGPHRLVSAVIDPANHFAYFGTDWRFEDALPATIVRVDLTTFTEAGSITLTAPCCIDRQYPVSGVIDVPNHLAYFASSGGPGGWPHFIVKIDLSTFTQVGTIELDNSEVPVSPSVIDEANQLAYFGIVSTSNAGGIVKVDLANFRRVAEMTLNPGEIGLVAAVIDPDNAYAYFGTNTEPGKVVKVDVSPVRMTKTVTVSVTTTSTPVADTRLNILASPGPARGGSKVTFTVILSGDYHELRGPVSGKQIIVSAFGTSALCTTNSLGVCQVTLVSPKTPGDYVVTAQFAGDSFFAPSSASLTTKVK